MTRGGAFMDNDILLKMYIPMVDFIADVIGPHCEVILHKVDTIENSVIAIRNGYISGRQIGCPLTDLAVEFIQKRIYLERNAVINYLSETTNGEKLRSSTFFIKNPQGILIGMICVNIVDSPENIVVKDLATKLVNALMPDNSSPIKKVTKEEKSEELLSTSIDTVVDSLVAKIISENGVPVDRMSIEEKIFIVQKLSSNGIFKIKGAITKIASSLKISESTVYRYLSTK